MALARTGDGDRTHRLLRLLNPIEHARDAQSVWHYGIEPYVVAADVYRLPERVGQGGWSWYTGSAAWMYRAWLEEVLGLQVRGNHLFIHPVVPAAWTSFKLYYRYGAGLYLIDVQNPDDFQSEVLWRELDDRRLTEDHIEIVTEPVEHRVVVRMGKDQT